MNDQQQPTASQSDDWERNFRSHMKALREAQGMTQTDLARELKSRGYPFHQPTVQRVETGERPIRLNEALAVAGIFGRGLDDMISSPVPTDHHVRYTVDRLLRASGATADDLFARLVQWDQAVEEFAGVLWMRATAGGTDVEPESIDDVSRWALAWAHKVIGVRAHFVEAWQRMFALGDPLPALGGEERAPEPKLPAEEFIEELKTLYILFRDADLDEATRQESIKLYAAFPGVQDGADGGD